MTLEELNQHLALRQQLQRDREHLALLEARAVPGAQVLTGMPHAPGFSNKVEAFAVEIAELNTIIENLESEISEQQKDIEAWISTIKTDWVRLVFRFRFLHALQWKEVAYLMGPNYTEESVCRMCYRYLTAADDDQ